MSTELVYDTIADGYGVGVGMQIGAGVRVGLSENVALDLGYRMRGVLEAPFTGAEDARFNAPPTAYHSNGGWSAHSIQAGLVFGPGANPVFLSDDSPLESVYVSAFGGAALVPSIPFIIGGDVFDFKQDDGHTISGAVGVELPRKFRA